MIPVLPAVITVAQFPELTLLMPLTAWVVKEAWYRAINIHIDSARIK